MSLDSIYDASPVWMQNLMCSVKGWMIQRRRYGKQFQEELSRYHAGFYNQEKELIDFLDAVKDVEAYKGIITKDDIILCRKEKGHVYQLIAQFPIIGKIEVKTHIKDYENTTFTGEKIEMRTSGTTGSGLIFPYSVDMENKQWAIWWNYRVGLGLSLDTWCGWFGGKKMISLDSKNPPFWRINKPGRQVMFSSDHLTENTVKIFCDEIVRRNLTWLHGYPSHIARLAALMIKTGCKPIECVTTVTTGAENVLGNQVELVKKAFPKAIMRQHYGLNEGVANISQNREGEWKVDDQFCYVEFIPVEKGSNVCHIVGTGFSNYAFPLIRYDTGDLATVEWNTDGTVSKILSIDGRSSNFILQPDGTQIGEARLSIFLHDYLCIDEAQFHQDSPNEVDLWIVKGTGYSEDVERDIYEKAKLWFDPRLSFHIVYVNKVERTKSGKLKLVVSEIQ